MSTRHAVLTPEAPAAIGPYSQAVKAGGTVYVSGQLGVDPATGGFAGLDAAAQTRRALMNLSAVLQAAGSGLDEVVKVTVYLADMEAFGEVNRVYAEFFRPPFPARACIQAARLPKSALVEIEAVAVGRA
ncbi:MAG: Enamine/imine deaminase [Lentisphaerae bacterium ADurb.BinA184]|nr:MAG: Enamine/imine deaminase [Lentisphaerae bacterium ADurb.BinA184]